MFTTNPRLSPLLLLLALTYALNVGAFAQEPAPKPTAKSPRDEGARAPDLHSKIWWNQPTKVSELMLSQEQRTKMDALLTSYLESRSDGPRRQRAALNAMGEALVAGNEAAARAAGKELAEVMSGGVREQTEMMVEVIALLTPQQRQKLGSSYPRLLSQLWVRTANPQQLMRRTRSQ